MRKGPVVAGVVRSLGWPEHPNTMSSMLEKGLVGDGGGIYWDQIMESLERHA